MKDKIFDCAIYLSILSLPLYLIRFSVFGLPTNVLEMMVCLALAIWLTFKAKDFTPAQFSGKRFCLPIILIYLGAVLSVLFSQNIRVSAGILKGWFIAPLIFAFLVVDFIKTRKQIRNIVFVLLLDGLGVALIGLFYWSRGALTYDGRLRAFYLSPNHLAMFLSPVLILPLYLYSYLKKNISKILLFIVHCLLFVVICLTYSLGAWLGTTAGVLIFFFLPRGAESRRRKPAARGKKKNKIVFSAAFCFLIVVSLIFLPRQKIRELLNFSEPSLKSRLVIWRVALEIAKDHPLVGIGPGMFQKHYLDYQTKFPPYPEWAAPQPHNLFLAFWLQTGLLGLIGFVWLLVVFFLNLKKIRDNSLKTILSAAMVCLIIHGLADTPYWKNDLALIFWLVTALNYRASCFFYSQKSDSPLVGSAKD